MAHKVQLVIDATSKKAEEELKRVETSLNNLGKETEKWREQFGKKAQKDMSETEKALNKFYNSNYIKTMKDMNSAGAAFGKSHEYIQKQIRATEAQMSKLIKAGLENSEAFTKMKYTLDQLKTAYEKTAPPQQSFALRMRNLITSFVSAQLVVYAFRIAIMKTVSTIRDASQASADLEETLNLFFTTFENSYDRAVIAVEKLTDRIKIAKSTAMDALGAVGDMAIGFGATDEEAMALAETTVQLVADLMSFKNIEGDLTENVSAFTSGLLGNTKNLRRYGIIVRDANVEANLLRKGLSELTGEERELAKVQERLNIAIEQSPKAIGDMEKTLDSTVNVTRRFGEEWKEFKENMGYGLNKFFTPIKQAAINIIEPFNDIGSTVKGLERIIDSGTVHYEDMEAATEALSFAQEELNNHIKGTPQWITAVGRFEKIVDLVQKVESLYDPQALSEASRIQELNVRISDVQDTIDDTVSSYYELNAELEKSIKSLKDVDSLEAQILDAQNEKDSALSIIQNKYKIQTQLLNEQNAQFYKYMDLLDEQETSEAIITEYYDKRVRYLERMQVIENAITAQKTSQAAMAAAATAAESFGGRIGEIESLTAGVVFESSLVGTDEREAAEKRLLHQRAAYLSDINDEHFEALKLQERWVSVQQKTSNTLRRQLNLAVSMNAPYAERRILIDEVNESEAKELEATSKLNELRDKMSPTEQAIYDYFSAQLTLLGLQNAEIDKQEARAKELLEIEERKAYILSKQLADTERLTQLGESAREKSKIAHSYWEMAQGPNFTARLQQENAINTIESARSNYDMTGDQYRQAIYAAHMEYLQAIDGAQAIADGIREGFKSGDWSKAIDGFAAMAKQGTFGQIGKLATGSDPLAMFIEVLVSELSEMEEFGRIMNFMTSILSDAEPYLQSVMSSLYPFLPLLDMITNLLNLLAPVLNVLYPIFQILATAVAVVILPFQQVAALLGWFGESIEVLVWNLTHIFQPGKWRKVSNLGDTLSDLNDAFQNTIEEIWKPFDQVAQSADKLADAFERLEDLYGRGRITATDMVTIASGLNGGAPDYMAAGGADFITKGPTTILAGEAGRERVHITPAPINGDSSGGNIGNVTIYINGAGSPESTARAVAIELNRLKRRGIIDVA